ncbi:MAG TPA: tetratricopeptide repeat protein [Burkholderiaceae bacterium]|nr:tetratricopeptide repeat protein [Burkholderiaceae bacterium]
MLLTDVVDSTRLSVQVGDAEMARLWAAHDRAARDLLPLWHGREIDKTDGMLLLFDAADDAVRYALAYQQALSQLAPSLRARVGVHVGPVTLRENTASDVSRGAKPVEVEGVAKATAARVMSVAQGGQILLSADAWQALCADGLNLQSHGHWRLKGLDEPIELFEVCQHAAFSPPPDAEKAYRVVWQGDLWTPAREVRNSLPAEGDSFVGRSAALAEISQQFQSGARLVSILGIGGTGKTRLATRFGRCWLGDFPGGVWFCDLTPARSVAGIASAVAQGLDVPLGKEDPVVQLGHAIAGRGPCLVIIDNFEQVARHAAETLGHWLARAERARFLVTTREVLGVAGEVVLPLLPLPPADSESLLVQRMQSAKPDYQATAEDESAINRLVTLLEGLPLAIELAAARVRVMPPRTMLVRMSERFKLLTSRGGRHDRQATLRAALDWSWDLLNPIEKATLAQLSVFEGGFTLEAAEGVLDLSAFDGASWAVDAVNSLVDKSFVRARSGERFDLLVSVQIYAAEHLHTQGAYAGSGPQAVSAAQARHVAWFAGLGPARAEEAACADLDNLVAACRRAISLSDGDSAAGALEGAWAAFYRRGPYLAAAELAQSVCAMPGLGDRAAGRAHCVHSRALLFSGHQKPAAASCEQALVHARAAGDRACEAQVLEQMSSVLEKQGRSHEAHARDLEALRLANDLHDRYLQCTVLNGLAGTELSLGRMEEALAHFEQALTLARETGDRRMQGNMVSNLAGLHDALGHIDTAIAMFEEALRIARSAGDRRLEGSTLCNLGWHYLIENRLDDSTTASQQALSLARDLGFARLECIVRCNLGIVLERQARMNEAREQFEGAVRMARELNEPRYEGQFLGYLGLLHARERRPEEATRCLDAGESLLRSVSDRLGLGVLLTGKAEAMHLTGKAAAASVSLAEAQGIAIEVGAEPASELGLAIARVGSLLPGTVRAPRAR